MSEKIFRNILYGSDRSGTMKWRRIWPIQSIDCIAQGANIQADYTQTIITDPKYYNDITSITIQRWISKDQKDIVAGFFRPLCNKNGAWLIYEIDDAMHYDEIPKFNKGREAFESDAIQENIKTMLNQADLVTVTTDYIKQYYNRKYGVPLQNIIAIPNFLPRYLFADRYDPDKKLAQFAKFKAKPRVGIVSSLSHYNTEGAKEDAEGKVCRLKNQPDGTKKWIRQDGKECPDESQLSLIKDDMEEIIQCVKDTVNDVQWVFFGYCPTALEDLAKKRLIEVYPAVQIMNYASGLDHLHLQAIVAPIADIEFNRCKSFIKYMEAAALGIPLLASKSLPYTRIMPEQQLFASTDELKSKIIDLKFSSVGKYRKIIESQWKWLNSEHDEGDFHVKNFWLEDNLEIWAQLFKLKSKTIFVDFEKFKEAKKQREANEKANTIYKNDNGVVITR